MHDTIDIPDATELLDAFLKGDDRDAAFATLVERLGGLVFASALRRTGDPSLAEDVTQNVFAVLANKAKALRSHPSLIAWVFKATQFEASKVMRTERRRKKKHDALAREVTPANLAPENSDEWQEAIPILDRTLDELSEKDRDIVLQRFFQKRKFAEIATYSGRSEAACKMQLKRALDKLSRLLRSRGVALPATTVASALASELAKAAPVQTLATVAPKALAASSSLSAGTLITHSALTMSTVKTATLTTAAVVALSAVPFAWQQSNAADKRDDLRELDQRYSHLEQQVATAHQDDSPLTPEGGATPITESVRDLLAAANENIDVAELLDSMMQVMANQDMVGMVKVFLPLTRLTPDQHRELMEQIEAHQGHAQVKQMALQMIGTLSPEENPRDSIDRLVKLKVQPYSYAPMIGEWAITDPDGATAWFLEKLEAGDLDGASVHYSPDQVILGELLHGIASKDPMRAIAFYKQHRSDDQNAQVLNKIAPGVGAYVKETGDTAPLRALVEANEPNLHAMTVSGAVERIIAPKEFDRGLAITNELLAEPELRNEAVLNMLNSHTIASFSERAEWVAQAFPDTEATDLLQQFITSASRRSDPTIAEWVDSQPAGVTRDRGNQALAEASLSRRDFEQAFARIQEIGDAEMRDKSLDRVARTWVRNDADQAAEHLSAELIERYQRFNPRQPQ